MMKRQNATFVASSKNSPFSMTKLDQMLTIWWNNCPMAQTKLRKYWEPKSPNVSMLRRMTKPNVVGLSVDLLASNKPTCNWFVPAPKKIKTEKKKNWLIRFTKTKSINCHIFWDCCISKEYLDIIKKEWKNECKEKIFSIESMY